MIKTLLRTLLILIMLGAALATFLLTPMGLRFSFYMAEKLLPGKLHYRSVSGVLIGPITVNQLEYKNQNTEWTAQKLYFDWQPLNLLKGKWQIQTVRIDGLRIVNRSPSTPLTEKEIKEWFTETKSWIQNHTIIHQIRIDHAVITQFSFQSGSIEAATQKITLRWILEKNHWDIALFSDIQKPTELQTQFLLTGNPAQYQFQLKFTGKQTLWSCDGTGNSNTLTLQTQHNQLLGGTLDANLTVQTKPTLQWQGKIQSAFHHNQSLVINTQGKMNHTLLTQNNIILHSAHGDFNLQADLSTVWQIHWQTKLLNWHTVFSRKKFDIHSDGKITGDLSDPQFSGLFVAKLHSNTNRKKELRIQTQGSLQKNVLTADLYFPHRQLQIKITGAVHDRQWHGMLNQFTVTLTHLHHFYLEKPVALYAATDAFSIPRFCLLSKNEGNLCIQSSWIKKQLHGEIQLHITQFGWLRAFLKEFQLANGNILANITLNGTLEKPIITGEMQLTNSRIPIPQLNITLSRVTAKIITDADQKIRLFVKAFSQNRPIELNGTVDLSQPHFIATGTLTCDHLLIMNTEQYVFYVTSQLKAAIDNHDIHLSGTILIPKGKIAPHDFQITTTLPTNDIVYTGMDKIKNTPFWNIFIHTTVKLGNDVHIHASGLDAILGGAVTITQSPEKDPFGTGEITVKKGTYLMYGRTLQISKNSSLIFDNSLLNNPELNVKAEKTIRTLSSGIGISDFAERKLLVGIALHGTVKEPKITFFSNRSNISQTGILSYLLVGYDTTSSIAPGNTEYLLRGLAAVDVTSQGLLGKQNIASEIRSGLGLSELGVESDTTSDALGNPLSRQSAFVIGKHLTRRLYVRYTIGMYNGGVVNPIDVFELRYLLNKNWAVQGDSSTLGNGADILYTIQKN